MPITSTFPALGKGGERVKLGTVDYKNLTNPHSGVDFLTELVEDELGQANADAVILPDRSWLLSKVYRRM